MHGLCGLPRKNPGAPVWLYADSRLIYPSQFVGRERRVYLEGEAYFLVTKNPERPFVIGTERMEARVLGTELNVSCRKDADSPWHVALVTGKVEVQNRNTISLLEPGQGVTITDDGGMLVAEEDMERYTSFRDGFILFDDMALSDIAQQLGRWFNVSVEISSERLASMRLHFLYKRSDDMKRILTLLNSFGEFKAVIRNNTLLIGE